VDKRHILAEIRRTADANGGVALGRRAFEIETGIRESDWAGRHWARWSDAVREAGLTPNRMLEAFDEDRLLAPLVSFIRELGRFPVTHEMRMRKRTDDELPNEKVFSRRFGTRAQLAKHVIGYCERIGDLDDVAEICASVAGSAGEAEEPADTGPEPEFGFVYLLKSGRYYKIGRTNALGRREYEIGLQLPEAANTVHTIKTDDPAGIESYWHRRFADRRKNGEWFELSADDVRAFKRRRFM
jgi:hypothetical protein